MPDLWPTPVRPARCARCHRRTARAHLVDGFGPDCAQLLGLATATPRLGLHVQTGPDLFDDLDEGDRDGPESG